MASPSGKALWSIQKLLQTCSAGRQARPGGAPQAGAWPAAPRALQVGTAAASPASGSCSALGHTPSAPGRPWCRVGGAPRQVAVTPGASQPRWGRSTPAPPPQACSCQELPGAARGAQGPIPNESRSSLCSSPETWVGAAGWVPDWGRREPVPTGHRPGQIRRPSGTGGEAPRKVLWSPGRQAGRRRQEHSPVGARRGRGLEAWRSPPHPPQGPSPPDRPRPKGLVLQALWALGTRRPGAEACPGGPGVGVATVGRGWSGSVSRPSPWDCLVAILCSEVW